MAWIFPPKLIYIMAEIFYYAFKKTKKKNQFIFFDICIGKVQYYSTKPNA